MSNKSVSWPAFSENVGKGHDACLWCLLEIFGNVLSRNCLSVVTAQDGTECYEEG
jgi:hypothetical protein